MKTAACHHGQKLILNCKDSCQPRSASKTAMLVTFPLYDSLTSQFTLQQAEFCPGEEENCL